MNYLDELKKVLEIDRKNLLLSIERAKEARDKAPSAMESHSDTTRNQNEKLVLALELQLKDLNEKVNEIPGIPPELNNTVQTWNVTTIKMNDKEIKILIVPEGLGGKKFSEIITVAENSPLGKAVIGKGIGEQFSVNESQGIIEEVN